ncbi:MAG: DUF4159 domain-containing protein [Ignavibacteriaceae bacterium]|nr:DUF4159 domain-containing protein [Ignavibacteriaceae bacterium]
MKSIIFTFLLAAQIVLAQSGEFRLARVKYQGGGDWYNDQSADINLMRYISENTNLKVKAEYTFVDLSSDDLSAWPVLFLTGHGNIVFSENEAKKLRDYLTNGGFLYVDDDYGLDQAFRREIKKVFPERELTEVPYSHKIYNILFRFPDGPPKTHKHDEKPAQGFGIFYDERLVLYYTYESNPSDGWADPEVHNDTEEKRIEALKFGTNIVLYALTN